MLPIDAGLDRHGLTTEASERIVDFLRQVRTGGE
jgi:hypothetical protein